MWTITEDAFDPKSLHHQETIFTIGNGYLSTRGAFEEGYPGARGATFIHGRSRGNGGAAIVSTGGRKARAR